MEAEDEQTPPGSLGPFLVPPIFFAFIVLYFCHNDETRSRKFASRVKKQQQSSLKEMKEAVRVTRQVCSVCPESEKLIVNTAVVTILVPSQDGLYSCVSF